MENMAGLKKIIVTGGTGFIGSHLTEELTKFKKYNIHAVDIKLDPLSYFSKKKLKNKAELKLIDIRDRKKIDAFILKLKPNYIFHLAAEPIVERSYENPYNAFETNIMGTVNLLESCRKLGSVEGIIVASSDKAYGKTDKAYNESSPLRGDHPYDVSKSCQDLIAQTYFKTYDLPTVITRFGNVYGEGDLYFNRIIPGICKAVVKKEKLLIRSDGTFIRDYLYVKDVVNGYMFLLKNLEKVKGEAFNFSSKDTLSVLEVIEKAEKILGKKIPYKILNIAKNEIPYQHLNDNKIRKLGWSSGYDLNNSLPLALDWYENLL